MSRLEKKKRISFLTAAVGRSCKTPLLLTGAGLVDIAKASKGVAAVDVHCTAAANPLPAGAAKGQSGVLLALYLYKDVQHHRTAFIKVYWVRREVRLRGAGRRRRVFVERLGTQKWESGM